MNTTLLGYLLYTIFLTIDFVGIFAIIIMVRYRPGFLGPARTLRKKGDMASRERIGGRMDELGKASNSFFPLKILCDGRRLIVIKDRLAAAQVVATWDGDGVELKCSPRVYHFLHFALMMMIMSFFLGPFALIMVAGAVVHTRKFNDELFRLMKKHMGPRRRPGGGKRKARSIGKADREKSSGKRKRNADRTE